MLLVIIYGPVVGISLPHIIAVRGKCSTLLPGHVYAPLTPPDFIPWPAPAVLKGRLQPLQADGCIVPTWRHAALALTWTWTRNTRYPIEIFVISEDTDRRTVDEKLFSSVPYSVFERDQKQRLRYMDKLKWVHHSRSSVLMRIDYFSIIQQENNWRLFPHCTRKEHYV